MRIDPEKRLDALRPTKPRAKTTSQTTDKPTTEGDLLALGQVQAMVGQLMEMPEIREEIVKLGQRLAEDPNYPPPEVVEEMAKMLARALRS